MDDKPPVYSFIQERVNVLLNPGFLLVILNVCSENLADFVFIPKLRSNSGLKKLPIYHTNAE